MTVLAGPEGRWAPPGATESGVGPGAVMPRPRAGPIVEGGPAVVGDPRGLTVDGIPVAVLRVGRDLPDPRGVIRRAYRLGAESAVLVRPDGVVAWRHDSAADPATLVSAVRTAVGRAVPAAVAV